MKVLITEDGKKLFFNGKTDFHTHLGILKFKDIDKAKNGKTIKSNTGKKFLVLEPSFIDHFENLKRGPQIITLKDAGIIAAYTGVSSGWKVVEAGSGSGALTIFLANLVKPNGKVYSYEKRKDFFNLSKKNIENSGLEKFVKLKNKDIYKKINEKKVDLIVLDLPEPWKAIESINKSLKIGGFLVIYLPTINQIMHVYEKLKNFKIMKISEILERNWKIGYATRPLSQMITHTAFLIFARKL